ncbi:MAG: hypothetical protein SPI25_07175 [Dialister sp.]|nr:hypothetical protein [Dialister sp.]
MEYRETIRDSNPPYNAFKADAYDTLPISVGMVGILGESIVGGSVGGAILGGIISVGTNAWVAMEKDKREQQRLSSVNEEKNSETGGEKMNYLVDSIFCNLVYFAICILLVKYILYKNSLF